MGGKWVGERGRAVRFPRCRGGAPPRCGCPAKCRWGDLRRVGPGVNPPAEADGGAPASRRMPMAPVTGGARRMQIVAPFTSNPPRPHDPRTPTPCGRLHSPGHHRVPRHRATRRRSPAWPHAYIEKARQDWGVAGLGVAIVRSVIDQILTTPARARPRPRPAPREVPHRPGARPDRALRAARRRPTPHPEPRPRRPATRRDVRRARSSNRGVASVAAGHGPHRDRAAEGPRGAPAERRSRRAPSVGARAVDNRAVYSSDPDRSSFPSCSWCSAPATRRQDSDGPRRTPFGGSSCWLAEPRPLL